MDKEYDRTDMPDEANGKFYVDDFGEQIREDEALPERGEGQSPDDTLPVADDGLDNSAFYEQAPGTMLDDSYRAMPSDTDLGLGQDQDDDYDPLAFRPEDDEAI